MLPIVLLNTLTASPDRTHVLRSTALIVGSTFVLEFIVLAPRSQTDGGWVQRVLLASLGGVTLGTLTQPRFASVTGDVAFAALILFLVGLALLPRVPDCSYDTPWRRKMAIRMTRSAGRLARTIPEGSE